MSEKEKKKFNLEEIDGERYLGRVEDVLEYLRYALNQMILSFMAEGFTWEEVEPSLGELWKYILDLADEHNCSYTIRECPMSASGITLQKFEEKA